MGSLLRFSRAGTNEVSALPALNPDFLYAALDATAYAAFVKEIRRSARSESRLFHGALKRPSPSINAGAPTSDQIEQPLRLVDNPRVKSGNLTGALP
jgi:hypothetical protein